VKRRVIAAVTALLLAVVGGVLLLAYVSAADRRAMADLTPTSVLVVTKAVPEGATAGEIEKSVEVRELPGVAVAPDATSSLDELGKLVTTTALQPGEQLLRSRLADPAALQAAKGVKVPPGMHQVSLQLEPQRAVGGKVAAGDTVGVFLSIEEKEVTSTQLKLHKVLVTAVAGGPAPAAEDGSAEAQPAQQTMTVTLAAEATAVGKIIFAAEHGTIWLSAEPADAPDDTAPVLTKGNLYK
jgi:pilus assembly protein CpaB